MSRSVMSILLFIAASHVYQVSSEELNFPTYVQNNPDDPEDRWNFHTKLNGENYELYFHSGNVTAQGISGIVLMNFSVVHITTDETNGDIYYIQTNENSTDGVFPDILCLIFHNRTSHVVQISSGKANKTNEYTCQSPRIIEWPLVANKVRKWSAELCPLIGGFNIKKIASILHPSEEEIYCDTQPIKALMESECSDYEGIQLTFADKTCIPKYTGWSLEQQLTCLDTWDLGDYQYAILGDSSAKDYHPQYCMRVPKSMADEDEIMIFLDMMCPEEEPHNYTSYITLNVTKKSAGLCEDEPLEVCANNQCVHPLYKATCRATCGYCDDVQNNQCAFDSAVITPGNWTLTMDTGFPNQAEVVLTFDESSITWQQTNLSMTCSQESDTSFHDTYVMNVSTVDGCLPRYTCGKFWRASPSVLQYKLSKFKTDTLVANDLCAEDNFEEDPWPLGSLIRSQHNNILVAEDNQLRSQTVPCNFMGNHTLNVTVYMSSGSMDCTGSLSDFGQCVPQNNITVDVNCNNNNYITDIDCLASIDFGSTSYNALITYNTRKDAPHRHVCWVIVPGTDPVEFYVMTSPQCDPGTLADISTGDRLPGVHAVAHKIEQCTLNPTTDTPVSTEANVTNIPDVSTDSGTNSPTTSGIWSSAPENGTEGTTTNGTGPSSVKPKTTEQSPGDSNGPSAGEVIGILIGVILGAILVGALGWFVYRQYLARKQPYRVL